MGLLDDAIRQHLELKRRHGADEAEVARLESEALGPVRAPRADPPAADPPAAEPRVESPRAPAAADEPLPAAPADPEPPQGDELADLPEARPADPAPLPEADAPVDSSPFTADEPWLEDPDEVPAHEGLDHPRSQETAEFTPDERAAATGGSDRVPAKEEPAEDLLEETPDFLQETPEHDRLWFEQKPPRDFDFGG